MKLISHPKKLNKNQESDLETEDIDSDLKRQILLPINFINTDNIGAAYVYPTSVIVVVADADGCGFKHY